MNCAKFQKLYMLHLDGSLSRDKEETLQRHLAQCLSCQGEIQEIQKVCAALQKGGAGVSDSLLRKIKTRAQEKLLGESQRLAFIPRLESLLPRLSYAFIVIIAAAICILLSLPARQPQLVFKEKAELNYAPAAKAGQDGFTDDIEKRLEDIYTAQAKKDLRDTFSVLDRAVNAAGPVYAPEYLSFSLISEVMTIEDSLKDLERQVSGILPL